MSSYDDDSTGRRGYGDGGYGGNTTTGSSRGDEGYGVQPTEYRKGSEADLTSALQSSDARGGMMGAGDESYGVRENLFEPPGVLIEPKRADWDLESSLPAAASAAAWALSSGRTGADDSYGSSGRGGDDSYGSGGGSTFGSGITGGAGSGNKLSSGADESTGLPSDYGTGHSGDTTDRNEAYSGHREYGSGMTGGPGFGNKSSGHRESESSFGGNVDVARNSDPYTGHGEYGSGSTGGAGYGNKSSNRDSDDGPKDSTSGKIMEKVGGMLGNTKMQEKGSAKREQAGYGEGGYGGSNDNNY
ncbi:MAG: hypothetical protein Q9206_007109 [Seirophora lacunosa]